MACAISTPCLHEILRPAAAPEAAAEHHLVHLDLLERDAGRLRGRGHRGLRRSASTSTLPRSRRASPTRCRPSAPSSRGSGTATSTRPRHLRRRRDGRRRIARPSSPPDLRVGEALAQHRHDGRIRRLRRTCPGPTRPSPVLSAWLARHQLSATTATKSSARTTCFTPRIFSAAAESTLFTLPPNTGHCAIEACSMPGSVTSVAENGLAHHLVRDVEAAHAACRRSSSRFGSRSFTSLGGWSFAACAATCP